MKTQPIPNTVNLLVLEWSFKQQTFHIHTVEEMIERNLASCVGSRDPTSDWIPVAFGHTYKALDDLTQSIHPSLASS
jgi:hypothetical protein